MSQATATAPAIEFKSRPMHPMETLLLKGLAGEPIRLEHYAQVADGRVRAYFTKLPDGRTELDVHADTPSNRRPSVAEVDAATKLAPELAFVYVQHDCEGTCCVHMVSSAINGGTTTSEPKAAPRFRKIELSMMHQLGFTLRGGHSICAWTSDTNGRKLNAYLWEVGSDRFFTVHAFEENSPSALTTAEAEAACDMVKDHVLTPRTDVVMPPNSLAFQARPKEAAPKAVATPAPTEPAAMTANGPTELADAGQVRELVMRRGSVWMAEQIAEALYDAHRDPQKQPAASAN